MVVSLVVLALGVPPRAWAITATAELRRYTDEVIRILQDPRLTPAARRAAVRDIADEAFDVKETARRVLGPHWQERTGAEQEEFVRVFHDFLEQTYLSRLDLYRGERVRYVSERQDGERAVVHAMIVMRLGMEIPVESRLLKRSGRWRVYDVLIEQRSLVGSYRSQFDRIIRTGSYAELVDRLKAHVERAAETTPRGATAPAR